MANFKNLTERIKYRKSGIYTITNLVNGKIYVGYALSLTDRKSNHLTTLFKKTHKNIYLQKAYNKYGRENFVFEILEECSKEFLTALEHYWCTILNTHNDKYGYNIIPTNPNNGHNSGYKRPLSEETKKRIKDNYVFTPALQAACKESIKLAQAAIKEKGRTKEHSLNQVKSKFPNYKLIEAYDINTGELFGIYELASDAAIATKTNRSSISSNLLGRSKSTKNFIFKYKLS